LIDSLAVKLYRVGVVFSLDKVPHRMGIWESRDDLWGLMICSTGSSYVDAVVPRYHVLLRLLSP
jgi:hypothetical protein